MIPTPLRRAAAAAAALAAVTTSLAGSPAMADEVADRTAAASAAILDPTITWRACTGSLAALSEQMPDIECGDLTVPLDYSDPSLGTIELGLSRRRAASPAQRIGVMFTNPGGPGDSATLGAPYFAEVLGRDVRARFDVLGLAPRGVEGTQRATCPTPAGVAPQPGVAFPMTPDEIRNRFAADQALADSCAEQADPLMEHMGTADDARDMDLARRALGESQINFFGISYGSHLGATYAAMFADKVRTMTVDGVVDPVGWATGHSAWMATNRPTMERLFAGGGAKETMLAAIAECERAGSAACSPAETIREDWTRLTQTLRMHPVILPDGSLLRYDQVFDNALGVLYDPTMIPALMPAVHHLAVDLADPETRAATDRPMGPAVRRGSWKTLSTVRSLSSMAVRARQRFGGTQDAPAGTKGVDVAFSAVLCSESPTPTGDQAWLAADDRAIGDTGGFGQAWLWNTSLCARWPFRAANTFRGSYNAPTQAPVLIMTSDHDPATPELGATTYHRTVTNSRLVTVRNGFGHGALGLSACAEQARTTYMVTGRAPSADLVCEPDRPLFGQP